jgi:RsmE family RNA methyltransferase
VNLILIEPDELGDDAAVTLSGPRAEHMRAVLKVAPGDTVRIGVVDGGIGTGTVAGVGPDSVVLRCQLELPPPPPPLVDLLLALPRPKVLQRLWAQLAALGVARVVLTNAARVERDYFDTHVVTPSCYRPLLVEGLQQARDTRLPCVSIHRRFRVLVEDELDALCPNTIRVVAHPGEAPSIPDLMRRRAGRRVLLAVGPEGGWNEFEMRLLQAHGFEVAALGLRTLRSDTACVASLALVHEVLRRAASSP